MLRLRLHNHGHEAGRGAGRLPVAGKRSTPRRGPIARDSKLLHGANAHGAHGKQQLSKDWVARLENRSGFCPVLSRFVTVVPRPFGERCGA